MRAKEFLKENDTVESQIDDDSTQTPELEEDPVMIPPLQQALEIDKAKLDPSRAKRSKAIRQLLDKAKTQYLPNQPK